MLLLTHISIAILSLVFSGAALIFPSKMKITISYALVAATIGTGTAEVIQTHTPLAQACVSGLVYLALVTIGIVAAQRRLKKLF